MLTKLLLQKIWLIIDQLEEEVLELTDVELIRTVQLLLIKETELDRQEIRYIAEYIQSRISLIRDLAEIRTIQLRKTVT